MKKIVQITIITVLLSVFLGIFYFYLHIRNRDNDFQIHLLNESIDQKKYFIYSLHLFLFNAEDSLILKRQTAQIYEILKIYDRIVTGIDNSAQIREDLTLFIERIRYYQRINKELEKIDKFLSFTNFQNKNNIKNRIMLVTNHILDEFIRWDYLWTTYSISGLHIVNVAKQDTVKYGEYYESIILYDIYDLARETMIVIDNKDTLYSRDFKEKALVRGKNKKEGLQYFVLKDGLHIYKFEIEYFVE